MMLASLLFRTPTIETRGWCFEILVDVIWDETRMELKHAVVYCY